MPIRRKPIGTRIIQRHCHRCRQRFDTVVTYQIEAGKPSRQLCEHCYWMLTEGRWHRMVARATLPHTPPAAATLRPKKVEPGTTQPVLSRRLRIYHRDEQRCVYCRLPLEYAACTLDHVLPRSRGGVTADENLVLCCMPCNNRKGNRTPEEWQAALRRGLREEE